MEQTNYKQLYDELLKSFEEIKAENNELKIKNDELSTHLPYYTHKKAHYLEFRTLQ
jgi:cell division septum initiation protein DivIVA